MKASEKALNQNPEGRGFHFSNSGYKYLGNHSGEVTYNVSLGVNGFSGYTMLGHLKFSTLKDAREYVSSMGAVEGVTKGQEYYSITKQEGCAFSSIGFYSVK